MEEHVHGGREPEVVAKDLERPNEGLGVRVELAGCNVELCHQLLLKESEGQSQLQSLENSGVDEGEGNPIGGPVIHADKHPSRGDAHLDVKVILPVERAGGLVRVIAQQGGKVTLGQLGGRF